MVNAVVLFKAAPPVLFKNHCIALPVAIKLLTVGWSILQYVWFAVASGGFVRLNTADISALDDWHWPLEIVHVKTYVPGKLTVAVEFGEVLFAKLTVPGPLFKVRFQFQKEECLLPMELKSSYIMIDLDLLLQLLE